MSRISRRSFLTASAVASGSSMLLSAQAGDVIPGFDQTKTDVDATQAWEPFSDRKVRVGIVGHGVANSVCNLDSSIIPTSSWLRSVICSRTAAPKWLEWRNVQRRTRRWRRWLRMSPSRPSFAPRMLHLMPGMRSFVWSTANMLRRRSPRSLEILRTPKDSSNAAGRTKDWLTPCSKPHVFMTISTPWKSSMRPAFLVGSSIPRANTVILILWGHLGWALTRTGE